MIFKHLRITNWRQFRELDLEFHERLTVLTGANGAGKTTVLNLLSRHFGWQGTLIGTPRRQKDGMAFYSDCWTEDSLKDYEEWLQGRSHSSEEPPAPIAPAGDQQYIGELVYGNDQTTRLSVASNVGGHSSISTLTNNPRGAYTFHRTGRFTLTNQSRTFRLCQDGGIKPSTCIRI